MAFLQTENVRIAGISACVPKQIEENAAYPHFSPEGLRNFITTTGIERKRKAKPEICASDLCISAAEKLIADLHWDKEEISILVFVSQTPDYILPATSPIIQEKLGINKSCYTLDISLGCSGWVYGMSVVSALLANTLPTPNTQHPTQNAKALLLVGDTLSKIVSNEDKSTYPLFGDAGTATALEYKPGSAPLLFGMNSDGKGYEAIIINDGGYRNPFKTASLDMIKRGDGIISNNLQLILNGMDVFSFGIREAPKSVNELIEKFGLNKEEIDYFTFHQANLFMNEQIRKKCKLPAEKVPYSLKDFGNTSSASIPLTIVTQLRNEVTTKELRHVACGFGVGLSWGSSCFITDRIICPPLVEI